MSESKEVRSQDQIKSVLDPIATRAGHGFVEIDSDLIRMESPFSRIPSIVKYSIGVVRHAFRSHKKAAVIFIAVVIVAELMLRSIEPRLAGRIYSSTHTAGYPIAMNEHGFRGDSVQIEKPEKVRRILALGDSVTFGTGIAVDDTWPAQLKRQMQTRQQMVEVINAGLPGQDLRQIYLELEGRWRVFSPEQAVIVVTGNMISFGYARKGGPATLRERTPTPKEGELDFLAQVKQRLVSLALPSLLTMGMDHLKYAVGLQNHEVDPKYTVGVMLAHGYSQSGISQPMIKEAWSIFESQLGSLVSKAEQLGIPISVVYAPPRFMLSKDWQDNLKSVDRRRLTVDPVARTAAICQRLGVPFLDPRIALAEAENPIYVLADYTHFDANGNLVLATMIADSLRAP